MKSGAAGGGIGGGGGSQFLSVLRGGSCLVLKDLSKKFFYRVGVFLFFLFLEIQFCDVD